MKKDSFEQVIARNLDGVYWDKNNLTQGMIYSKMMVAMDEWGRIQKDEGKKEQMVESLKINDIKFKNKDMDNYVCRKQKATLISRIDKVLNRYDNSIVYKSFVRELRRILLTTK